MVLRIIDPRVPGRVLVAATSDQLLSGKIEAVSIGPRVRDTASLVHVLSKIETRKYRQTRSREGLGAP
jgi:hypothetical protein